MGRRPVVTFFLPRRGLGPSHPVDEVEKGQPGASKRVRQPPLALQKPAVLPNHTVPLPGGGILSALEAPAGCRGPCHCVCVCVFFLQ